MKKLTKILPTIMALAMVAVIGLPALASAADFDLEIPGEAIDKTTPAELINPILIWVFGLIGLVCVVVIVIAGVQIATSGENEDKRKKNIKALTWALIGLVIVLVAYSLVAIIGKGVTGAVK